MNLEMLRQWLIEQGLKVSALYVGATTEFMVWLSRSSLLIVDAGSHFGIANIKRIQLWHAAWAEPDCFERALGFIYDYRRDVVPAVV